MDEKFKTIDEQRLWNDEPLSNWDGTDSITIFTK